MPSSFFINYMQLKMTHYLPIKKIKISSDQVIDNSSKKLLVHALVEQELLCKQKLGKNTVTCFDEEGIPAAITCSKCKLKVDKLKLEPDCSVPISSFV